MAEYLSMVIISLAFAGLFFVVLEDVIHVNKAQAVLFFGTLSWLLLFAFSGHEARHENVIEGLYENIAEIAGLWLFLLAAMTFVVYLNKKE